MFLLILCLFTGLFLRSVFSDMSILQDCYGSIANIARVTEADMLNTPCSSDSARAICQFVKVN